MSLHGGSLKDETSTTAPVQPSEDTSHSSHHDDEDVTIAAGPHRGPSDYGLLSELFRILSQDNDHITAGALQAAMSIDVVDGSDKPALESTIFKLLEECGGSIAFNQFYHTMFKLGLLENMKKATSKSRSESPPQRACDRETISYDTSDASSPDIPTCSSPEVDSDVERYYTPVDFRSPAMMQADGPFLHQRPSMTSQTAESLMLRRIRELEDALHQSEHRRNKAEQTLQLHIEELSEEMQSNAELQNQLDDARRKLQDAQRQLRERFVSGRHTPSDEDCSDSELPTSRRRRPPSLRLRLELNGALEREAVAVEAKQRVEAQLQQLKDEEAQRASSAQHRISQLQLDLDSTRQELESSYVTIAHLERALVLEQREKQRIGQQLQDVADMAQISDVDPAHVAEQRSPQAHGLLDVGLQPNSCRDAESQRHRSSSIPLDRELATLSPTSASRLSFADAAVQHGACLSSSATQTSSPLKQDASTQTEAAGEDSEHRSNDGGAGSCRRSSWRSTVPCIDQEDSDSDGRGSLGSKTHQSSNNTHDDAQLLKSFAAALSRRAVQTGTQLKSLAISTRAAAAVKTVRLQVQSSLFNAANAFEIVGGTLQRVSRPLLQPLANVSLHRNDVKRLPPKPSFAVQYGHRQASPSPLRRRLASPSAIASYMSCAFQSVFVTWQPDFNRGTDVDWLPTSRGWVLATSVILASQVLDKHIDMDDVPVSARALVHVAALAALVWS